MISGSKNHVNRRVFLYTRRCFFKQTYLLPRFKNSWMIAPTENLPRIHPQLYELVETKNISVRTFSDKHRYISILSRTRYKTEREREPPSVIAFRNVKYPFYRGVLYALFVRLSKQISSKITEISEYSSQL